MSTQPRKPAGSPNSTGGQYDVNPVRECQSARARPAARRKLRPKDAPRQGAGARLV